MAFILVIHTLAGIFNLFFTAEEEGECMFGPLQHDRKQDTVTAAYMKQAFNSLTTFPDIYSTAPEGLNDHHVKLNLLLIYLTSKE